MNQVLQLITLGDIFSALSFVAAVAGAVKAISAATRRHVEKAMKPVTEEIKRVDMHARRLELLLLLNNQPAKADVIEQCYDEYKAAGGNSYMDSAIKEWRELYERDIIRERLLRPSGAELKMEN